MHGCLVLLAPATAQAAIQQLSYDPTNDRVAPGSTETTTFTINVDDATLNTNDSTTTVVSTSINDNPSFSGTPSISGTATVGSTLSAANTATTDNDTGYGITLSYHRFRQLRSTANCCLAAGRISLSMITAAWLQRWERKVSARRRAVLLQKSHPR